MKHLLLVLLLTLGSAALATAADGLAVENAWIREAPPGASMLAGYLTIDNRSADDNALVGVASPLFAHVMLHKSETVDGVARMLHQDRIAVPAHARVQLQPGGYHLMMPAPESRLKSGDEVPLELRFADGSTLRVTAAVRKKP